MAVTRFAVVNSKYEDSMVPVWSRRLYDACDGRGDL